MPFYALVRVREINDNPRMSQIKITHAASLLIETSLGDELVFVHAALKTKKKTFVIVEQKYTRRKKCIRFHFVQNAKTNSKDHLIVGI